MRRRGDHGTLADRTARSREREPPPVALRHCWVVGPEGALPGLLLGWERRASGWWGRAVHPVPAADAGWAVVEEWLPADRLRPVAAGPGDPGPPTLPGSEPRR